MVTEKQETPFIFDSRLRFAVSGIKVFPSAGVIFRSGSNVLKMEVTIISRPLKTDKITISAIVPTATPATDTAEMILMAFRDFFANRYLFAMYNDSFTVIAFLL